MKRYEYWYTHGIMVDGVMLVGRALDDYTDLQIWLEAHPGQDPVQRILLGGNDA